MSRLIAFVGVLCVSYAPIVWSQSDAPAATAADEARLEELMDLMSEEMAVLRATEDVQDRASLMATHREHMREAMALMSGMGGETMSRMLEHMNAAAPAATGQRPRRHVHRRPMVSRSSMTDAQRLVDLEARVDMMQMMMESMLEQEAE